MLVRCLRNAWSIDALPVWLLFQEGRRVSSASSFSRRGVRFSSVAFPFLRPLWLPLRREARGSVARKASKA
jgi:hypothetical protein